MSADSNLSTLCVDSVSADRCVLLAAPFRRVVNVSVRPSHASVRLCQLDKPLVRPTSIRVTTR